jgi:hypothetical protein
MGFLPFPVGTFFKILFTIIQLLFQTISRAASFIEPVLRDNYAGETVKLVENLLVGE